ncbi:hypothetical protein Tco_1142989 [Tanacetum coccineum]
MTLLQGASSIRETSLIGSSLLAKTSIKHSSTPSVPILSSSLNEEIFSMLMSLFIGNWFVSSLLHLSSMPLLVGQSRENATLSRLRDCNTVKESRLLMEFWLTIRDGGLNVGNTKEEEDKEDDEGDEAAGGGAGHEEAEGSTAMYRNMIQGDWQVRQACWMDLQDEQ